jgi:outer membrane protein assembly factor BamB
MIAEKIRVTVEDIAIEKAICLRIVTAWLSAAILTSLPLASQAAPAYPANPSLAKSVLYVSTGGVTRIDRQSGQVDWQVLSQEQTFEPVIVENHILVGTSAGLVALERETGDILWRRFTQETIFSPVVDNGIAYVASRSGFLRALELSENRLQWERQLEGWIYPPAIAGNVLVTGGQGATLWGIDARSGDIQWQRLLSQELFYRPVVEERTADQQTVFVTTFAGNLLAINGYDGSVRWHYEGDVVSTAPMVDNGRVYVGGLDGLFKVFVSATGELIHRHRYGDESLHPSAVSKAEVALVGDSGAITVLDTTQYAVKRRFPGTRSIIGSLWFEEGRLKFVQSSDRASSVAIKSSLDERHDGEVH